MTLIGFHAAEKAAHLLTDTIRYTFNVREMGQTTKRMPLDHLDAVVATQGDIEFARYAQLAVQAAAAEADTFDELVSRAAPAVRQLLEDFKASTGVDPGEGFVVLLGYSRQAQRFQGWVALAEDDYEFRLHDGPFVYPMPWSAQPPQWQVDRIVEGTFGYTDPDWLAETMATWRSQPPLQAPATDEDWTALAHLIRQERSLQRWAGTIVGGQAFLTKLRRGTTSTRRLFHFNDHGAELYRLTEGTHHPVQQTSPCPCGSGKPALHCHMAALLDRPCSCSSEQPFRECCAVSI